jgi:hypothetical protein
MLKADVRVLTVSPPAQRGEDYNDDEPLVIEQEGANLTGRATCDCAHKESGAAGPSGTPKDQTIPPTKHAKTQYWDSAEYQVFMALRNQDWRYAEERRRRDAEQLRLNWERCLALAEEFRSQILPPELWQPVGSKVSDWRKSPEFARAAARYKAKLKSQEEVFYEEDFSITYYTMETWTIEAPPVVAVPVPKPAPATKREPGAKRTVPGYRPHFKFDNAAILQWITEHPKAKGREVAAQFGCSMTRVSQIRLAAGFAPRKRGPLEGTPSPRKGWRTLRKTPAEHCLNGCGKPGALYSEECTGQYCSRECARTAARNTPGRKEKIQAAMKLWAAKRKALRDGRMSDTTSSEAAAQPSAQSSSDASHSTTAPELSADRSTGRLPLED